MTERPFAGDTARFYRRYRREYPPELIARLARFSESGRGRLLDLGCGTGQLALQLAGHFSEVVGMDPEPEMLREAELAAAERGSGGNVRWMIGRAEDLGRLEATLGRFDLVTIGTALHLMEPLPTLGEVQRVAAGGEVAVAYNGSPMWLHPEPWARALRGVLEARLGTLDDIDFTAEALDGADIAMRELGYSHIERWEHRFTEAIDADFVVGHILSATSTEQIPPGQREAFAQEVSKAMAAVTTSGRLVEEVSVRAVIGQARQ